MRFATMLVVVLGACDGPCGSDEAVGFYQADPQYGPGPIVGLANGNVAAMWSAGVWTSSTASEVRTHAGIVGPGGVVRESDLGTYKPGALAVGGTETALFGAGGGEREPPMLLVAAGATTAIATRGANPAAVFDGSAYQVFSVEAGAIAHEVVGEDGAVASGAAIDARATAGYAVESLVAVGDGAGGALLLVTEHRTDHVNDARQYALLVGAAGASVRAWDVPVSVSVLQPVYAGDAYLVRGSAPAPTLWTIAPDGTVAQSAIPDGALALSSVVAAPDGLYGVDVNGYEYGVGALADIVAIEPGFAAWAPAGAQVLPSLRDYAFDTALAQDLAVVSGAVAHDAIDTAYEQPLGADEQVARNALSLDAGTWRAPIARDGAPRRVFSCRD